jgi:hypothetical protein
VRGSLAASLVPAFLMRSFFLLPTNREPPPIEDTPTRRSAVN